VEGPGSILPGLLALSEANRLDGSLTDELVDGEAQGMGRELIKRRKERKQREAQATRAVEAPPAPQPEPEPQPMIAAPALEAPAEPPPVPSGPMDETWKRAKAAVEASRQAEKEGIRKKKDPCGYFQKNST
jgi:hypothetical protein